MVSEIESDSNYYIDLIEEEISLTCWRQYTKFMPDDQAHSMLEEKNTMLEVGDRDGDDDDDEYGSDDSDGMGSHHSALSQT